MISNDTCFHEEKIRDKSHISYCNINKLPLPDLDEITKSTSIIFDSPISAIGLMDQKNLTFISKVGLTLDSCDKETSFFKYTIEAGDLFVVEDSQDDDRFQNIPMDQGFPLLRFYAGIPLLTPTGLKIGTLFVADKKPRRLTHDQQLVLKSIAKQVIMCFELTRHKEELEILREQQNQISLTKEDFFRSMSHDLRTPLNSISGFTEILSETKLDNNQKDLVKIIKSSIEILISIVNDILDFSKIESGNLKLEDRVFNLKKFLKRIFKIFRIKAQEKNLDFEVKIGENIPTYILGDELRLKQILMNLLGNAVKFTEKGNIKLGVEIINQSQEEVELKFSVQDTGIGILEKNLDLIFEKFHQVEGNTRVYGGTGIGLSIVNKLVELQHGKINVKSELGKGSEFNVSINYLIE